MVFFFIAALLLCGQEVDGRSIAENARIAADNAGDGFVERHAEAYHTGINRYVDPKNDRKEDRNPVGWCN